ncbi:PREDICTED: WAP four-disulfide core domain protein 1 [Bison bison bison]|uniref:WAP four-disulfide core domain protein 1 n=1 Tax=Bison bison bison TaxID=43346 RepID=A0A6P3IBS7_BISBB|nr:PREDICTED: WAP four-disulfide core domain protein 1 [Bison bison bison]
MGSGRRKVSWTLCFLLLLLLEATSTKNLWKRALPSRLAERARAEEVGGSRQPRADRCPPPPRSQAGSYRASYKKDKMAPLLVAEAHKVCLSVLDWLVQPKPRWLGGNGWLLDGPEEVLQAEACSTTEDGAEPLLCPSGYECHILSPGDLAAGIPELNPLISFSDGRFLRQKFYKEYPEGASKYVAEHGQGQQRHFQ